MSLSFCHSMITGKDKLSDIISLYIDLLPIVDRLGLSVQIGEKSIAEACRDTGTSLHFALEVLNTFASAGYFPKPEDIGLEELIAFLVGTHRYHEEVTIPRLNGLIRQLKQCMPGERLPVVTEKYLHEYIDNLLKHIDFEEKEIFPLVGDTSGTINQSRLACLKQLFHQHTNVEQELSDLKTIIIRHIPAGVDRPVIHDLLHTLSHFEKEQIDHARFEDKILIPKLLALYAI